VQGHLYRYPHPYDATKFIYCGQGQNRDKRHRFGHTTFGLKFKRDFPGVELPQPVREVVEVADHLELNELETIWMFQYHTWRRAYPSGYNIVLPGSQDYKKIGVIGAAIGGRKNAESGLMDRIRTKESCRKGGLIGGRTLGRRAVDSGLLARIQVIGGRTSAHVRWHTKRSIVSLACEYCYREAAA